MNRKHLIGDFLAIEAANEDIHVDTDTVVNALTIASFHPCRYPRRQREVYGLCDIEACVEATVIGCSSRDDEFAFALHDFVHFYTIREKDFGLNQGSLVAKKLRTLPI